MFRWRFHIGTVTIFAQVDAGGAIRTVLRHLFARFHKYSVRPGSREEQLFLTEKLRPVCLGGCTFCENGPIFLGKEVASGYCGFDCCDCFDLWWWDDHAGFAADDSCPNRLISIQTDPIPARPGWGPVLKYSEFTACCYRRGSLAGSSLRCCWRCRCNCRLLEDF